MKRILFAALIAGVWANTAIAETFDWSGIYGGVSVGARWSDTKADTPLPEWDKYYSADGTSFTGGGFIGYNFQHENFVFGPDVSVQFTSDAAHSDKRPFFPVGYFLESYRPKATVSVNGRLGYSVGAALPYLTAGYTRTWYDNIHLATYPGWEYEFTTSFVRNGWNVGVGTDWRFTDHIFGRAEYRYIDLGTQNLGSGWERRFTQHAATLGIGYKF